MASFQYTIPVDAVPEHLWALVKDVRRIASLFPYTEVEEFHAASPDCWEFIRRIAVQNIVNLCWRERAWLAGDNALCFKAIEGDLEQFEGRWTVGGNGAGATLTLTVDYMVPEHLQPSMPRMLMDYVMNEMLKKICHQVKAAAEGREA